MSETEFERQAERTLEQMSSLGTSVSAEEFETLVQSARNIQDLNALSRKLLQMQGSQKLELNDSMRESVRQRLTQLREESKQTQTAEVRDRLEDLRAYIHLSQLIGQQGPKPAPSNVSKEADPDLDNVGKFGKFIEKIFTQVSALMQKLQDYGSDMLASMAKFFKSIGWVKAAEYLQEMAQSDYAVLRKVTGKKIQAPVLKSEDKNDQEAVAHYENEMQGFNAKLEELGALYQTSQGYAKKEDFFRAAVREAVKKNPAGYTIDDVLAAAKTVPQVNPQRVPEKPENFPTLNALAPNTNLMTDPPTKINVTGKVVGLHILSNGTLELNNNGVILRYGIHESAPRVDMKAGTIAQLTIIGALWTPAGVALNEQINYTNNGNVSSTATETKVVAGTEFDRFLANALSPTPVGKFSTVAADFEKIPVV